MITRTLTLTITAPDAAWNGHAASEGWADDLIALLAQSEQVTLENVTDAR